VPRGKGYRWLANQLSVSSQGIVGGFLTSAGRSKKEAGGWYTITDRKLKTPMIISCVIYWSLHCRPSVIMHCYRLFVCIPSSHTI